MEEYTQNQFIDESNDSVNCCTDDHISSMVTTDSELGGANIQQKNGIGGKSSIPGKLCWNEVVISDYTLPVSYDCPFEFEEEMWENGGITLDLRFNLVVDLELIFVASNGVCYETTIISGETGPFIFTKTGNSEAPFNPDEILEEKNDEPVELEQPVNDTTDDNVTENCECAVAFDGQTGSYVNVPYRENPSTLTVVCHFKVDSHDNVNVGVDDKKTQYLIFQQNTRTSGNTGAYYVKYTETTSTRGTLTIGMSSEEGVVVEASTPVSHIRVFQTYMLHAVFGSTSLKLYLDGEIISTETTNFDINYHSEHTLHLGRKRAMGDNTDNFFAGKMFSFYVYAKELSADYIKAFFNTHKCEQIPFPTPTPSNTPTETTTPSPVPSPTSTYTPTHTLTHTPSSTETPTSTHTPTWTTTVLPPPALIGTTPDKQYYDNTMRILEYENEIHKRTHNLNPGDKIDASEFGIEGSDATFPRYAHSMYLHLQGISVDKETAYIKGESNSKYQYTFAPYGYKNKTEEGTWKDITSEYVKLDSSVIRDADATTDRVNGCNVLFFRIKDENRKMDTEDCIGPISNSTNNNIVFDKENFNIKITKNNGQDFVFTETLSSRVLPPRDGELIMTVKGKDQIKTCYPITGGHPNYNIQPANGAGGPVGLEYRFKQNDGWGNWNPVSIPGQENPVIGADNDEEWQFRVFGGTHGITTGVGERDLRLVEMKIKGMAYLTTIKNIGRESGWNTNFPEVGNKWTTLKKLDFSEFDMRSMTTFTSIGSYQSNLTEVLTGPKNDTKCITGNFSNFMYNSDSFTNCDLSNWCLINADNVADFSDPERPNLKLPKTEDC